MTGGSPPSSSLPQARSFGDSLRAMVGICVAIVLVAVDQTVVVTALPTIVAELRGFDLYAWVATSYLLLSVVTVPIFGRLGDYYGRKPFVIAAIIVFTLASVVCGFATNMTWLVVGRGLQGIGGGMLIGTAFAIVSDLFPDAHVRLRWQVLVSSTFGIANALGPSVGGLLTHAWGWRSVFFVNVPLGLLGLVLAWRFLPHIRHTAHDQPVRIDWAGAALIIVSLGSLQLVMQSWPESGATPANIGLAVLCVSSVGALAWCERRCPYPLLPLELFRDPRIMPLFVLAALSGFGMFTALVYLPLLLQGGFGLSARQAGVLITPLVVCITIGSIINGRFVTRMRRPNRMLFIGYSLVTVGFVGMTLLQDDTPHALIVATMLLAGVGLGIALPNLTIFGQEAAPRAQLGIVTALMQSVRMVGGMVGTALVGALVSALYLSAVRKSLADIGAASWQSQFDDPQVLVSAETRYAFLNAASAAGVNGPAMVEAARDALVSSVQVGLWIAAVMFMMAVWRARSVPPIEFRRRGLPPAARPTGE
jgi:EmrB/QacA subfamily drug resistance transporter